MRLIVDAKASADPVVGVRWCFGKEEADALLQRCKDTMKVLIVSLYEDGTQDRLLIPAHEIMTFVSFRRPGTVRLISGLVSVSDMCIDRITKKVNHRKYDWGIIDSSGGLSGHDIGMDVIVTASPAILNIPAEHFPAELPKWVQDVANLGFSFPASDQCQMRRRMLGFPFKLVGFGLWAVLRTLIRLVVALVAWTSMSSGQVNWSAVVHPWRDDILDVLSDMPMEWALDFLGSASNPDWWKILIHPWLWTLGSGIVTIVKICKHLTYWQIVKAVFHSIFFFVSHIWLAIVIILMAWVIGALIANNVDFEARKNARLLASQEEERLKREALKELLTCKTGLEANLKSIPSSNRTIRLRYLNLKRKVCRPFAS